MSIESAFKDELEKIAAGKTVQKMFDFTKPETPSKPAPKQDPYKKPKEVHIGTMYKQNPKGMSALAKAILDKIGRKPK